MGQKSTEDRIQRLEDIQEIHNVMGRYEHSLAAGDYDVAESCFALNTPGVRAEIGAGGVYEGAEGIRRLYSGLHGMIQGSQKSGMIPGRVFRGQHTTPVVEVAGDGKTAKGIWYHPCDGASPRKEDGKLEATSLFGTRAADFIKEDNQWKIWHYHVYILFKTSHGKSWVETDQLTSMLPPPDLPDELKPDRPTTYFWPYRPTTAPQPVPMIPEPYEIFDEKNAY